MGVEKQTKMFFKGVNTFSIDFKLVKMLPTSSSEQLTTQTNVNIVPKVFYPIEQSCQFNIIMDVSVSVPQYFSLALTSVGSFELNKSIQKESEEAQFFIHRNAPAIMFPYVRAFISTITANAGTHMNGIIIPTQFFPGELEEVKV